MKKSLMATMVWGLSTAAQAFSVSAAVDCRASIDGPLYATVNVRGTPDGEHLGRPGLVYLALKSEWQGDVTYFLDVNGVWSAWTGGMFPVTAVYRNGLTSINVQADVTQYLNGGYALYVGYGVFTAEMEQNVAVRRQAIERAKATPRGSQIRDISDDDYRRAMVEKDMRDNGRYTKVLPLVTCTQ